MISYKNWAVVSYKDNTGLGIQAAYLRSLLGIGYHLVSPSTRLDGKAIDNKSEIPIIAEMPKVDLMKLLKPFDGIIVLERNKWHKDLFAVTKELQKKIICMPNWEWLNPNENIYHRCDVFACPNHFAFMWLKKFGFKNVFQVPPPIDVRNFPSRIVSGKAKLFIHNVGLLDQDDRKATSQVVKAFSMINNSKIKLLVRSQKELSLDLKDDRIEIIIGDVEDNTELYKNGEVAIQPSKMEGIGFSILEPTVCGIPVITSNYPPMNEYGTGNLLVKVDKSKSIPYPRTKGVEHSHLVVPSESHLCRAIEWCTNNNLSHLSKRNQEWTNKNVTPEIILKKWQQLSSILN